MLGVDADEKNAMVTEKEDAGIAQAREVGDESPRVRRVGVVQLCSLN